MQSCCTYEDANGRRKPQPVAIAIARDMHGRCNPITLSWYMNTSIEPPLLAISIGRTRHSLAVIRRCGAFVLSIPAEGMAAATKLFGSASGREVDKLAESGLKTQPAERIDCVLLADAVINLECEVVSEHATGDHVIFVGRVVASHANADGEVRPLFTLGAERMGAVQPG